MMSEQEWDTVIAPTKDAFNYPAAVRCTMRKRYGRIVNITSVAGQMGNAADHSASVPGRSVSKALHEVAPKYHRKCYCCRLYRDEIGRVVEEFRQAIRPDSGEGMPRSCRCSRLLVRSTAISPGKSLSRRRHDHDVNTQGVRRTHGR
jgi:hypothetical protein